MGKLLEMTFKSVIFQNNKNIAIFIKLDLKIKDLPKAEEVGSTACVGFIRLEGGILIYSQLNSKLQPKRCFTSLMLETHVLFYAKMFYVPVFLSITKLTVQKKLKE